MSIIGTGSSINISEEQTMDGITAVDYSAGKPWKVARRERIMAEA